MANRHANIDANAEPNTESDEVPAFGNTLELFGSAGCPYTQEMRDSLEWRGADFVEYDVEADPIAFQRMRTLSGGQRTVPVLVENGKVVQIGWEGRGCVVGGN